MTYCQPSQTARSGRLILPSFSAASFLGILAQKLDFHIWLVSFHTGAVAINSVIFENSLLWCTITCITCIISFKLYNNLRRCSVFCPFLPMEIMTLRIWVTCSKMLFGKWCTKVPTESCLVPLSLGYSYMCLIMLSMCFHVLFSSHLWQIALNLSKVK